MSEWKEDRLEDLTELIVDCPHSTPKWKDEGVIVLRNQNIRNGRLDLSNPSYTDEEGYESRIKRAIPTYEDIVLTREAPMGEVCKVPQNLKCCLGQRMVLIRTKENILDSDFLLYSFQAPFLRHQILWNEGTGTTVSNIRIPFIKDFLVRFPAIEEQREIAKTLSNLDKKITLLGQQNQDLEKLAKTIFKQWFVEFEFPNENGKPYKSSGGNMVESELGEIPEGWRLGSLGEIITNYDSKRIPLSSNERAERKGNYPYHGATSIMDYVDDFIFDGRYLLLGEDGSVIDDKGFPFLQYVEGKIWVNNHAHVLEGKYPFSTNYIFLLLRKTRVNNIVTGAVQLKINQTNLNGLEVLIPSSQIVESFNDAVQGIFNKYFSNVEKIQTLTQLRDTLLPKLMSGELSVKL